MMGINEQWYGLDSTPATWTNGVTPENTWFKNDDYVRLKNAEANCIELQCFRIGDFIPNGVVDAQTEAFCNNWLGHQDDIRGYANWSRASGIYSVINVGAFGWYGFPNPSWAMPQFPAWMWRNANPPYPEPASEADYVQIRADWFNLNVSRQNPNRQAFIDAWAFIANKYKGNPYIIFNLLNEPTATAYYDANNPQYGQSYSQIMTSAIDAIRATGAENLIFVDRPYMYDANWNLCIYPIDRDIVWEDHTYMGDDHCLSVATGEQTIEKWEETVDNMVQMYHYGVSLPNHYGTLNAPPSPEFTVYTQTHPKPFHVGEYGIDPPSDCRNYFYDGSPLYNFNWKTILSRMVAKLDSSPTVGRLWYGHSDFAWKNAQDASSLPYWADPALGTIAYESITHPPNDPNSARYAWFTFEESDWIKKTVLGSPTPITLPFQDNFADLSKWTPINGIWSAP